MGANHRWLKGWGRLLSFLEHDGGNVVPNVPLSFHLQGRRTAQHDSGNSVPQARDLVRGRNDTTWHASLPRHHYPNGECLFQVT